MLSYTHVFTRLSLKRLAQGVGFRPTYALQVRMSGGPPCVPSQSLLTGLSSKLA